MQAIGKSFKGEKGTYTIKRHTKNNGKESPHGEIHSGGFGITWLAEDENQNEVVLKFPIETSQISGRKSTAEKTIEREIEILETMENPPDSIVKFLDKSSDPKEPFLAEEYLQGIDLWDEVSNSDNGRGDNCLSERVAIKYSKQIAEGLNYLHRTKPPLGPIVHRDLKPANIMVTKRGCVIIDLGVGKGDFDARDTKASSLQIARDNNFHCPQHTAGNGWYYVTEMCDVYALARMSFFMLTGYRTQQNEIWEFEDVVSHQMDEKKMEEKMKGFGVSEEFRKLIHKTLHPEHKYIPQAKSNVVAEEGWINQIDLISSGISAGSGGSSGGGGFRGTMGGRRGDPADLLKPHIICNGQRWDIKGDLCYLGRKHQCPTNKPEFLQVGMPNHHGCARDTGIDKDILRRSESILIDDDRIEYHHFKISKENKDYWIEDLQTRTCSGIIEGGRWQQLKPMQRKKLKNIARLAAGYSDQKGPELELSFYSE